MPSTHYLGNPKLKSANVPVEFAEEELAEYIKCQSDPVYFIKKYVKIIHVDKGLVPFDLYSFQENMVETFHDNRFVICKMPRQSGKSTTIIAFFLHYILTKRPNTTICFTRCMVTSNTKRMMSW